MSRQEVVKSGVIEKGKEANKLREIPLNASQCLSSMAKQLQVVRELQEWLEKEDMGLLRLLANVCHSHVDSASLLEFRCILQAVQQTARMMLVLELLRRQLNGEEAHGLFVRYFCTDAYADLMHDSVVDSLLKEEVKTFRQLMFNILVLNNCQLEAFVRRGHLLDSAHSCRNRLQACKDSLLVQVPGNACGGSAERLSSSLSANNSPASCKRRPTDTAFGMGVSSSALHELNVSGDLSLSEIAASNCGLESTAKGPWKSALSRATMPRTTSFMNNKEYLMHDSVPKIVSVESLAAPTTDTHSTGSPSLRQSRVAMEKTAGVRTLDASRAQQPSAYGPVASIGIMNRRCDDSRTVVLPGADSMVGPPDAGCLAVVPPGGSSAAVLPSTEKETICGHERRAKVMTENASVNFGSEARNVRKTIVDTVASEFSALRDDHKTVCRSILKSVLTERPSSVSCLVAVLRVQCPSNLLHIIQPVVNQLGTKKGRAIGVEEIACAIVSALSSHVITSDVPTGLLSESSAVATRLPVIFGSAWIKRCENLVTEKLATGTVAGRDDAADATISMPSMSCGCAAGCGRSAECAQQGEASHNPVQGVRHLSGALRMESHGPLALDQAAASGGPVALGQAAASAEPRALGVAAASLGLESKLKPYSRLATVPVVNGRRVFTGIHWARRVEPCVAADQQQPFGMSSGKTCADLPAGQQVLGTPLARHITVADQQTLAAPCSHHTTVADQHTLGAPLASCTTVPCQQALHAPLIDTLKSHCLASINCQPISANVSLSAEGPSAASSVNVDQVSAASFMSLRSTKMRQSTASRQVDVGASAKEQERRQRDLKLVEQKDRALLGCESLRKALQVRVRERPPSPLFGDSQSEPMATVTPCGVEFGSSSPSPISKDASVTNINAEVHADDHESQIMSSVAVHPGRNSMAWASSAVRLGEPDFASCVLSHVATQPSAAANAKRPASPLPGDNATKRPCLGLSPHLPSAMSLACAHEAGSLRGAESSDDDNVSFVSCSSRPATPLSHPVTEDMALDSEESAESLSVRVSQPAAVPLIERHLRGVNPCLVLLHKLDPASSPRHNDHAH